MEIRVREMKYDFEEDDVRTEPDYRITAIVVLPILR